MRPSCFNKPSQAKPSQANYKTVLKFSALSVVIAALSGCGEDAKDCGGFWDKTFGREECAVTPSSPAPANNNVVAPKITAVSPMQATVGAITTFTITGENLTDMVQVALPDCDALTVTARSGTQITFSCKPLSISSQKLVVSNGSTELFSSNVNFTVDKSDSTILKGVFVDSVTEGIGYKTDTMSGITDKDGTFYYRANETIEFMLGKNSLGEMPATGAIHVYDLNQTMTDVHFEKAQKVARLLQSLDMDNNPQNGIKLAPLVRDYFDKNTIDLYVTDEAFEQSVVGALSTLTSDKILVSKEEAYNHTEKSFYGLFPKIDLTNGCEEARNYVSDFNAIDLTGKFVARDDSKNTTTEGLSCDERRVVALYTNYMFDKQQQQVLNLTGQISKSINAFSEESLEKNPLRKGLDNIFQVVADLADTAKSGNKLNSAESVAKQVQSSVIIMNAISQFSLSFVKLLLSGNENAQEALEASKDITDALLKTTACFVDLKNFDVDTCFNAFAKNLEVTAKYINKDTLKKNELQTKGLLKQVAALFVGVSDIVDASKKEDYRRALMLGASAIAQVGVEAIKAEPNQTDKHKAWIKLIDGGVIPIAQSVKCVPVLSNAEVTDVVEDLGDCLTKVVYKGVVDNLFQIGFYSVATVNLTGKLQDAFEYSVAVAVARDLLHYGYTTPSGQKRLAAKWGFDPKKKFDVDAQVSRVIEILLDQKVENMGWVSRGLREVSLQLFGGGLFHSAIEVNRTKRMVVDILNEARAYADSDIDKYKIITSIDEKSNGLIVDAKVNFSLNSQDVKANGLLCYATESDHHKGNPYVFDNKAVNFKKDLSIKFEFLHAGTHELVCEAYGAYGRLGRSTRSIVIVQPSYEVKWKLDEDKVWAGQPAHFSLESNGVPLLVKWKFSGSSQEYVADPKEKVAFSFNKAGEYEVIATAIDIFGTTSTYKSSVNVLTGTVSANPTNPTTQNEVKLSVSTAIQAVKDVVWSFFNAIGAEVANFVKLLSDTFTWKFDSAEDYTVKATLRDVNDVVLGTASTIISVKPLVCSEGQIIESGKCVDIATLANGEANIALYGDVKKEMISTVKIDDGRTALLVDDVTAIYAAFGLDTRGKGLQDYVNTHINAVISMLKTNGATVNTLVNKPTRNAQGLAHNVVLDADFDSVVKSPADLRKLLLEYFNNKVLSTQLLNVVSTPSTKLRVTLSFWESNGNVFVWASVFPIDKSETVLQLYGDLNSTAAVTTAIKLQSQNNQQDFTQQAANLSGVDILWNVDNSGSMQEEQTNLANGAANFFSKLKATGIDYRLAVNTTDGRQCSLRKLTDGTNRFISSSTLNGENEWSILSRPGTNGSGTETAFYCVRELLEGVGSLAQDKAEFDRPNAKNLVVFVTDEPEIETYQNSKPTGSPSSYVARTFNDYKNFFVSSGATFFSIIEPNSTIVREDFTVSRPLVENCNGQGGSASGGAHFKEISKLTGGSSSSICADADSWSVMFDEVVRAATGLASNFKLSHVPIPSTIKVLVNGRSVLRDTNHAQGFDVVFSDSGAALAFYGNDIPIQNSIIQVEYRYLLN